MKNILLTIALLSVYLSSDTIKITGTKPVDEGQKLVHQEDTIKGSEDINNSYEYHEKSLEKMKNTFTVRRKNISHPPFTLLKENGTDGKITTLKIEKSSLNSVNFSVKKSLLNVGDRVLVINNKKSDNEDAPNGKEVIIEIEIIK